MTATFHARGRTPKVTLVGAGPGDPELITLKGMRVLQQADMVLYDALVSQEILDMIPAGTPSHCVGKRAGSHSYKQSEINELIVEFAYLYGHVVRLKGGDPFVFGRGSEEIAYATSHGVSTEMVPGISSALAVPASLNIPITARGISESFWVVTGTTQAGEISTDIALAAQSSATIIILMGLNKIHEIMEQFNRVGRENTPVAIIQHGTLPQQKVVIGKVSNISDLALSSAIGSPAIIVVGEVVNHAQSFSNLTQEIALQYQH